MIRVRRQAGRTGIEQGHFKEISIVWSGRKKGGDEKEKRKKKTRVPEGRTSRDFI